MRAKRSSPASLVRHREKRPSSSPPSLSDALTLVPRPRGGGARVVAAAGGVAAVGARPRPRRPAALATAKPLHRRQERELSSQAPLTFPGAPKMGSLAVDPLASNSTVQGVEYVLTGFDKLVNWARKSSLWPMTFGLA